MIGPPSRLPPAKKFIMARQWREHVDRTESERFGCCMLKVISVTLLGTCGVMLMASGIGR